jgi:hypothetical protein
VQAKPVPGQPETHASRVKIGYDREALYIGAFLEAPSADSILRELSQRDNRAMPTISKSSSIPTATRSTPTALP